MALLDLINTKVVSIVTKIRILKQITTILQQQRISILLYL